MILTEEGLKDTRTWKKGGYILPKFNREKMITATKENPAWIHFGMSSPLSTLPAILCEQLLDKGVSGTGLVIADIDESNITVKYKTHDNLSLRMTLGANGKFDKAVIGSVALSCVCSQSDTSDWETLKAVFCSKWLQLVSFTLADREYEVKDSAGIYTPEYFSDFCCGPADAKLFIPRVCALLYERYLYGDRMPLALVNLDGGVRDRLQQTIYSIVSEWVDRGLVDDGFWMYVISPDFVSYPWSITDKVVFPSGNFAAGVFSEIHPDNAVITFDYSTHYIIIEDSFPNGRPALEKTGVFFSDRDMVGSVVGMKKNRYLNLINGTLAIFGCLLGYVNTTDVLKVTSKNLMKNMIK